MGGSTGAAPGGFSYAQAARGQQGTPAPKARTDTASSDSVLASPSLATTKDWAEDVGAHTHSKTLENEEAQDTRPSELKASSVERMKLDHKMPSQSSGVSSPDMAASATSHDDVSSTAQNGTSLSSWEAKSQSSDTVVPSEPAWIAERKERQSTQKVETLKGGNTTIMPEQKPVVLQEAPPPAVNIWTQRAQDAKKTTAPPTPSRTASAPTSAAKDNAKLQSDSSQSNAATGRSESTPRKQDIAAKPAEAARPRNPRAENKGTNSQPPPVKDETSWPTPETSQEIERKASQPQVAVEDKLDDETSHAKPREKTKWKPVPVVPNVIFETPNVRGPRQPNGDRSARGGTGARGRGGARGALHNSSPTHAEPVSTPTDARPATKSNVDRSTMPPPSLPAHVQTKNSEQSQKPRTLSGTVDSDASAQNERIESSQRPNMIDDNAPKYHEHKREASALDNAFTASDSRQPEFASQMELRKDPRNGDAREQTWTGRGGPRRGRGRGGAGRETVNGHHFAQANGYDMTASFSPSSFNRQHFFNNNSYRGGRGGSSRSQSIPDTVSAFNGYPSPYGMMPQYAPSFDFNYPTQLPSLSHLDQDYVIAAMEPTVTQLDYYFSVENLASDIFLRKNMDSQGFVLVDVVMGFNRLKHITTDVEMIKVACMQSKVVDIFVGDDGKLRLRKITDYQAWILPEAERVSDAQTHGPSSFQYFVPPTPAFYQPQMPPRHQHYSVPNLMTARPGDRRSYDYSYAMPQAMSPHAMFSPAYMSGVSGSDMSNGDEFRGRSAHTGREDGVVDNSSGPTIESHPDADTFPEERIDELRVCVKIGKENLPQITASSRTFSNGSIDAEAVKEQSEKTTSTAVNGDASPESSHHSTDKKTASESTSPSDANAQDVSFFWIKDGDKPVGTVPSNLTPEPYLDIRAKALSQRNLVTADSCPHDLVVLYQFWSHFLIRNFNNKMYTEFVNYAHQDANERGSNVGQQNLMRYYDQALQSSNVVVPVRVAKDYLSLAKADTKSDAFKNLHRSWRDGALNIRSRKRLSDLVDAELRQLLEA